MKSLLICGANGFIGRNCLEFFAKHRSEQYNITATYFKEPPSLSEAEAELAGLDIDHTFPNVEYVKVDLREEEQVKNLLKGKDIIIQAAATTTGSKDVVERPFLHVTDNAVMNSWIFREAFLNKASHVIFPSCTVMYQPKEQPQKETDWSASDEIYHSYFGVGNTKVYLENMCDFYSRLTWHRSDARMCDGNGNQGGTKFTAIRHSNVYGPHDKYDLDKCHMVPALVNKVSQASSTLEIWGDGSARRDILYIDDLVEMIEACILNQKTSYELFNCGGGKAFSVKEIANAIMKVSGKNLTLQLDESKPNIPTVVILDSKKAEKELGWKPRTNIEEGLQKTCTWYTKNYK
tara:strand:+ start:6687 stop:7730 length:1044 start_codon:yes stop_codon:yes gene_type:complete